METTKQFNKVDPYDKGPKKGTTVRLYEYQSKYYIEKYGSIQNALDNLCPPFKVRKVTK